MRVRAAIAGLALGVLAGLAPAAECDTAPPAREAFTRAPRMDNTVVAIALGSGSMHGFAHIGVLEELEARGFETRVVTGTSAGALVGSLWASGLPAPQIDTLMREANWESARRLVLSRQALFS